MIRDLWATLYRSLNGFDPIPDDEIDAAVRQIMVDHPDDPAGEMRRRLDRMQWSKNHREQVKMTKVLKRLPGRSAFLG